MHQKSLFWVFIEIYVYDYRILPDSKFQNCHHTNPNHPYIRVLLLGYTANVEAQWFLHLEIKLKNRNPVNELLKICKSISVTKITGYKYLVLAIWIEFYHWILIETTYKHLTSILDKQI